MPVYRSIRIQMPDRPGALSSISAALAAHGVDIVRLDVISHEGLTVVDDLLLAAASQDDLGRAIGSFYGDITVRTFDDVHDDPVLQMGRGLASTAAAGTINASWDAVAMGARTLGRADTAALLRVSEDGGMTVLAGPSGLPAVQAGEPLAAAWALHRATPIGFPVFEGWATPEFQAGMDAAWVAAVPAGPDLLLVARRLNISFYQGELGRLAQFAAAASAVLRARGDIVERRLPAVSGHDVTPAKAITLNGLTVA